LEENVPNDNQRISLVEMHEIPVYESINENQMLSNLALAMQLVLTYQDAIPVVFN
jgi:hypothetical protein